MTRRLNDAGLALLQHFEQGPKGGPALQAYRCPAGVWTIGWGHTGKGAYEGAFIGLAMAVQYLQDDAARFAADVERLAPGLGENAHAALTCFAFNLGSAALQKSTLLRHLQAGNHAMAAAEFPRWNRAGGKVLAGLTRRRLAEQALFCSPDGKVPPKPWPDVKLQAA